MNKFIKKKVCILAPIHNYKDIRVFQKEAVTLAENNYAVTLIARTDYDRECNGVTILKSPKYNSRFKRFLMQPYLIFKALKIDADIYHLHNPDMLILGFFLKMLNKKVIYDTHEDFSKRIMMRDWIPFKFRKPIAKLIVKLEKIAANHFDAIIVTQNNLVKKYSPNALLLENAPILFNELIKESFNKSNEIEKNEKNIRLIYVGGITDTRGIKEIIQSLEIVNKKHPVRLWLIGRFSDKKLFEQFKNMKGWKYVDFLGELPQEIAFAHMIKSDIGLVTILDKGDHSATSPNKLFEYQRFGLPFIASDFKEWTKRCESTKSGIFINPSDINELANAINRLSENSEERKRFSYNGKKFIREEFNWEIESKKMLDLYNNILKRS